MHGVVLRRPGVLELFEQREPNAPGPTEALVATRRIGLCGTDYHAYAGYQPRSVGGFGSAPTSPGLGIDVDETLLGDPILSAR